MWDENVTPVCVLCGEPDTRTHRCLSCQALQHVRSKHVAACDIIRDLRPEWAYLPLPRDFDEAIIWRAFVAAIKMPVLEPPCETDAPVLRFCTDGGAIHPECHTARLATWSVIQDLSTDTSSRRSCVDYLFQTPPQLPLFRVGAMGLVCGDQNVSRGELQAIVAACQLAHMTSTYSMVEFVTDASYVISMIRVIESGQFKTVLRKLPNADLILSLDDLWKVGVFTIKKVKSHRSFESAKDIDDLWFIAGNYAADMVANLAFQLIPSCIRDCAQRAANFCKDEVERLYGVCNYFVSSIKPDVNF